MGGQEGDKGYITTSEGEFKVDTTIKLKGGKIGHVGTMTKGMLKLAVQLLLLQIQNTEQIHARIIVQHTFYRKH